MAPRLGFSFKQVNKIFWPKNGLVRTGVDSANWTATHATDFQFRANPRYRFAPPHRRQRRWARDDPMAIVGSSRHRLRQVAERCVTRGRRLASTLSESFSRHSERKTSSPNPP